MRLLLIILHAAGLMSCGTFDREAPEKMRYLLEVERPEEASTESAERGLEVRAFRVGPAFAASSLVYREGPGVWRADFYHEHFVPPGEMIGTLVGDWIRASGLFRASAPTTPKTVPHYILDGDVITLYGDTTTQPFEAVIALRIFLVEAGEGRVFLQEEYRVRETWQDGEPSGLVLAWNRALERILRDLESDLREVLATASAGIRH